MSRLQSWRQWRFELSGLFRDAGFSDNVIRKMDWGEFRRAWALGYSAAETYQEEIDAAR